MAKIRKLNVSEITGTSPYTGDTDAIMPSGTVVVYEKDNNGVIEHVLRVHDGVTNGGVAISPGPGPVIFNGSDGIVPSNLNEGIAAVFNNGSAYITGGNSLRFTGLGLFDGDSTAMLRFWDNEGRHSSGNDPTELVTLNVGNDAAEGDPTEGFFKIVTEKETGGEKEWKFDADGVLTLPTGGDIVDSTGASVLGGSGGDPNIWIQTFASQDGYPLDVVNLASSVEYDNAGNIIALFAHQTGIGEFNVPSGTYFSVAKFTAAGLKLWQVRLAADMGTDVYTDGWGLAVDNVDSRIYVAGRVDDEANYSKSSLIKLNSEDGSLIWSNVYDFGAASDSPVVDVDSEGNPIVVGYYSTEVDTNDGVTVTKIDRLDGTVVWSRLLDGQNDDEAYGMAVGPNNEVVAVGYTAQIGVIDAADDLYADLAGNLNWTVGGQFTGTDGLITADFTFTDGFPTFTNIVDRAGGRTIDDIVATVPGSAIGGVDGVDDMVVKVATVAANDEDDRMLVVKYDSTGAIQWQKAIQFDAGYSCRGADADIDSQGNVYVCGSYDYAGDGDTNSAMNLVKFDSSGVKQWSRRVVGPCEDFAASIVVGPDDTLYISGVTGSLVDNSPKYVWVVAKYTTAGAVVWQRLIENTTGWTFSGGGFFSTAGGSNLAVRQGYVALSGGFGIPFNNDTYAAVVQIDEDGTVFNIGDWEVKAASFSGTLNSTASDITVIDAGKVDSAITGIIVDDTLFSTDTTNFLIPTLYSAGGAGSELTNGEYTFALGNTGTVTLPAGGTITEGIVTSNPTIQLTPANPTVASQKLVIKGGGAFSAEDNGIFLTWNEINPQVTDTVNMVVVANAYSSQTLYWWIEPADAGIADPGTGTVEIDGSGNGVFTFTVDSDDYEFTVRVSPEDNNYDPDSIGVETQAFNADSPTYGDHHLHLTTGDLTATSIFLGTDDHNVRTTTDGSIQVTTPNTSNNLWTFDNVGGLTFPDATVQTTAYTGGGTATGVSRSDDNLIIRLTDPNNDGLELRSLVVNGSDMDVASTVLGTNGFIIRTNSNVSQQQWTFGNDGSTTLPGALVKSTVAKDATSGAPLYLGDSTWGTALVDGSYGPFTLSDIVFDVQVTGGTAVYNISNVLNNATFTREQTIGTLDSDDLGGTPGFSSNIAVTALIPLALDLTKSINSIGDGSYSLADGVEGQVMYLVPNTETIGSVDNVFVTVAHARDGASQYIDKILNPFFYYVGMAQIFTSICTLIYTQGHWQQIGGSWD